MVEEEDCEWELIRGETSSETYTMPRMALLMVQRIFDCPKTILSIAVPEVLA
jgi:hypothetical protein